MLAELINYAERRPRFEVSRASDRPEAFSYSSNSFCFNMHKGLCNFTSSKHARQSGVKPLFQARNRTRLLNATRGAPTKGLAAATAGSTPPLSDKDFAPTQDQQRALPVAFSTHVTVHKRQAARTASGNTTKKCCPWTWPANFDTAHSTQQL